MKKFDLSMAFSAGLEDDSQDVVDAITPEEADEIISQADNAETAAAEDVADATAEVEEDLEQADTLEDTAAALENFATVLDHAAEKGGLGKTAAFIAGVGVESHLDTIGMSLSSVMPGLESFGLEDDKSSATKNFGDKVKAVIAKIMEKVRQVIAGLTAKVAELAKRLAAWSPMLKRRANALRVAIGKLPEDTAGKEVKLNASLRKKLYIGAEGNVDLAAGLKAVEGLVADLAKAEPMKLRELAALKGAKGDAAGGIGAKLIAGLMSGKGADVKVPEGYELIGSSSELPGGKAVATIVKVADGKQVPKSTTVSLRPVREGDKVEGEATITAPGKSELIKLCNAVVSLCDNTDKLVKQGQQTGAQIQKLSKDIEAAAQKAAEEEGEEAKATALEFSELSTMLGKVGAQEFTIMSGYVLNNVAGASMKAVAAIVKASGGEAEAEEGKGEEKKEGEEA